MNEHLEVLERAISDTGCWRWWTESLPETFQIEFGMVQLLTKAAEPGRAPSSVIALRFERPIMAAFVTHETAPADFDAEWPRLLHEDELRPSPVSFEAFSFSDTEVFRDVLRRARSVEAIHGSTPTLDLVMAAPCKLAFWAPPIGLVVAAEEVVALTHEGALTPDEILERSRQWWAYWRDYWKRKDRADALPYDPSCEVTIPSAEGS
ncbi:MAG: hypothetical protein ACAI25_04275 [Planctomycetota bacterium]